ncbi:WSC-domain-containing protein [Xylariaceae sp. FL1272]|nr:WSC-domain-containing protein [Xylariaceae sp. FL1272]
MLSLTSTLAVIAVFTATVSAASNFQGNPLAAGTTVGNWKYLGCANEIDGRALTGSSYSDDSMTIESCQAYCLKNNFPLAGLEYGRECYCGKTIKSPSKVGQKNCNMGCKGNNKEMCGGNALVSIFNNTKFVAPGPPKTIGSWTYQSCFMEPQYGRALDILIKADDKMTIDMCTKACGAAKYPYSGVEYGRECWCGTKLSSQLKDASDPSCEMQCDMLCGGNAAQICGGRGAITIYKSGAKKRDVEIPDVDVMRARKGRFIQMRKPHVETHAGEVGE